MSRIHNVFIFAFSAGILLGTCVGSGAEEAFRPSKTPSPLQEEFTVIGLHTFDKTVWSLAIQYRAPECPLKRNTDVIRTVEEWAGSSQLLDERKGYLAEHQLMRNNLPAIRVLLQNMSLIGQGLGVFLYADTVKLPVRFARRDTLRTVIVTGVASESVYNTLRTTSKSRAAKVVQSMIIPCVRYFVEAFGTSALDRYGMCVTYGSSDFSEGDAYGNLEPETVVLVVPEGFAAQFVRGEITEDELLDASETYLSDRDLRLDFKKVKLTLE